jgi:hypothetical protein
LYKKNSFVLVKKSPAFVYWLGYSVPIEVKHKPINQKENIMESGRRFGVEIEFKSPFGHFDKETVADNLRMCLIQFSLMLAAERTC